MYNIDPAFQWKIIESFEGKRIGYRDQKEPSYCGISGSILELF